MFTISPELQRTNGWFTKEPIRNGVPQSSGRFVVSVLSIALCRE
jgi:hypothetical protein